jgi:glycosyltransferase involved in cell wall biosynthesis
VKIMLITDAWSPQVNGVVRTLTSTRELLRRQGHDIISITPLDFKTFPCPGYAEIRLALATPGMIGKIIDRENPEAIHIATEGPLGICARQACKKRRLDFTTAYHTQFPDYISVRTGLPVALVWKYVRWFHAASAQVLTATPTLAATLETHGLPHTRQWSRGVDVDLFNPRAGKLPAMQNLARPIQLYVGRVAPEKNIEAFLDMATAGSKVVVGDGPAGTALAQKYPDVHFLGVRHGVELAQAYTSADVFVFPSKTDTFGLVMLEALACGTPVAAFPVPGPLDVIGQNNCGVRSGFQQPVGALDADLAQAITNALRVPRDNCVRYAGFFSWQSCAAQFLDALVPVRPDRCVV